MNWDKFRQNVGMRFQLSPPARSVNANGVELFVPEPDYWTLAQFTGPDSFRLSRLWSGHVAELGKDHVYDFRSDPTGSSTGIPSGYLVLKMQIVVSGRDVRLIPNARPGEAVPSQQAGRRRVISAELRVKVLNFLRAYPTGTIGFASTQGDIEAHGYKEQLISLFRESGWDARDMQTFMFFGVKRGTVVTIPFKASESGAPQIIAQALHLLGGPVAGNRGDMANECKHYIEVWHAP
jgi:hypothetical protein